MNARQEETERVFLDCWFSEIARTRLREARSKFQGKPGAVPISR